MIITSKINFLIKYLKVITHKVHQLISIIKGGKQITNLELLEIFVSDQASKICAHAVIKYAQKRLGKAHYNLAKTTPKYNQDLVDCQVQLHALVLRDMYNILLRLFRCDTYSKELEIMMVKIHHLYVNSAPEDYPTKAFLYKQHLDYSSRSLADLANITGTELFKIIPAREGLLPSNVVVFQNQIRLAYIEFLEQLDKRIDKNLVKSDQSSNQWHG